jgi:hypothetical protein
MRARGLLIALSLLCTRTAAAQTPEPNVIGSTPVAPRANPDYLKVEFRSLHTLTITKNGEAVGPTFFSVLPQEIVQGSPEAQRHARHATVFQGFTLGFSVVAIGLIAAGGGVRASNRGDWTDASTYLVGGGVAALFLGSASALLKQNELFAAVNAYNYDLATRAMSR